MVQTRKYKDYKQNIERGVIQKQVHTYINSINTNNGK